MTITPPGTVAELHNKDKQSCKQAIIINDKNIFLLYFYNLYSDTHNTNRQAFSELTLVSFWLLDQMALITAQIALSAPTARQKLMRSVSQDLPPANIVKLPLIYFFFNKYGSLIAVFEFKHLSLFEYLQVIFPGRRVASATLNFVVFYLLGILALYLFINVSLSIYNLPLFPLDLVLGSLLQL